MIAALNKRKGLTPAPAYSFKIELIKWQRHTSVILSLSVNYSHLKLLIRVSVMGK